MFSYWAREDSEEIKYKKRCKNCKEYFGVKKSQPWHRRYCDPCSEKLKSYRKVDKDAALSFVEIDDFLTSDYTAKSIEE